MSLINLYILIITHPNSSHLYNSRSNNRTSTITSLLQQLGRESAVSPQPGLRWHHVILLTPFCAARYGRTPTWSRLIRLRTPVLSHNSTRTKGRGPTSIIPLVHVWQAQQSNVRICASRPDATSTTCAGGTPRRTSI